MMSAQHLLLPERLAELQELFTALKYRIGPTDSDSVERMEVVAKRAIQIVGDGPRTIGRLNRKKTPGLTSKKSLSF
jgi:hypothetical protein